MQLDNPHIRQKQLSVLKMRVEMIAWRVEEVGMTPEIQKALPETRLEVIETMLFESSIPDPQTLSLYEQVVCETEEALAKNLSFWRSGAETIH